MAFRSSSFTEHFAWEPQLLMPQHFTPPTLVSAQVCAPPAETALTPLESPVTFTGDVRSVLVPSPRRPWVLLPQHFKPP